MAPVTTRCRLLPLLAATVLLVLLTCESSQAQDEVSTDATDSSGRGNILTGLVDRGRRRRSDAKKGISLEDIVTGKRRKNKGLKRRGRKGGSKPDDLSNIVNDMDEEELARKIDILAEANQEIANNMAAEEQRREGQNRVRGAARKYFGGMGREFAGFPNRARETINEAVSEMLGGVNTVLRMIPYDEIEATALRVAEYVQGMVDRGVPTLFMDSLMSSRVGGARETLAALVEFQGSPEDLEPILEDIASNYRGYFKDAAGEVENFLSLLLPSRPPAQSEDIPPLEPLPPIDLTDLEEEAPEETGEADADTGPPTAGIAVGEPNPNTPDDDEE